MADNNPGSVIDELESAFRTLVSPLVTENACIGITYQEDQRASAEHAVKNFVDLLQQTEAFFIKQRASLAAKHPELVLQEEIEELEVEIKRKDEVLHGHAAKCKQWRKQLVEMQQSMQGFHGPDVIQQALPPGVLKKN